MNPLFKRILQLLFAILVQWLALFVSAWDLGWTAGWLYIGLYVGCLLLASMVLLPGHKEVIEERSKGAAGGKEWDLWLTRVMIVTSLGTLVIAGFEQRFGWPGETGQVGQFTGVGLFLLGYAIVIWAMFTNRFFSTIVRIQSERGHAAVTGGPYRFIRHPGYAGMLVSMLGSVLLLGTPWAFIPAGLYFAGVVIRTMLEDKTLQRELPGYAEFARSTRFRLLPGIW
ncbi:MAG TPA: isoprenylcysteine carboxylmethyltransferase family protein [Anaerolineales bacterium]|jgi:protein-S-isoprenylcysteine O-methyltransferase Ste14